MRKSQQIQSKRHATRGRVIEDKNRKAHNKAFHSRITSPYRMRELQDKRRRSIYDLEKQMIAQLQKRGDA